MEHSVVHESFEKLQNSVVCVHTCHCGFQVRGYGHDAEEARAVAKNVMLPHHFNVKLAQTKPVRSSRRIRYSRADLRRQETR